MLNSNYLKIKESRKQNSILQEQNNILEQSNEFEKEKLEKELEVKDRVDISKKEYLELIKDNKELNQIVAIYKNFFNELYSKIGTLKKVNKCIDLTKAIEIKAEYSEDYATLTDILYLKFKFEKRDLER